MSANIRRCFLAALVLVGTIVLAGAAGGLSPAWGQTGTASRDTADGAAGAREAANSWALRLLRSFPESIRRASPEDKRITFQPMDPRDVALGSRQRQLVYGWMLRALRKAGSFAFFTVEDPRDHDAVARALENTGVTNWFQVYQAALEKHRTAINLSCRSTPETPGVRLDCTAKDFHNLDTIGSADVHFHGEWLGAPLPLGQALEALAGDVAGKLRGRLDAVSIVDQRVKRESSLTKYVAETFQHRVVALQTALPTPSVVGGTAPPEPTYELRGKLVFLSDKFDLQIMVHSNDRPVNAVREYVTVESVAKVEEGLDPDRRLEPRDVFRDCDVCPEMVVIPPGDYMRGSPAGEKGRGKDEGPRRRVRIGAKLAVGRYEVTRREYAAFVNDTGRKNAGGCWVADGSLTEWRQDPGRSWRSPGFTQGERHPVVCVNWRDAKAYARWLSSRTGKTYRLLSEAEWEYAARAGTDTSRYWGDSETGQCKHANAADAAFGEKYRRRQSLRSSCQDHSPHTAEAGSHGANGFLLSDMLGNAWEWVEDCLHKDYSRAPDDGKAWVREGECGRRMLRGGSWYSPSARVRSAVRGSDALDSRNFDSGFRVARTLGP